MEMAVIVVELCLKVKSKRFTCVKLLETRGQKNSLKSIKNFKR